jgi:predicted nuclease of predicted toxin-antitoxin system
VKALLDACVWSGAQTDLAGAGHDIVHAGAWEHDPGDEEILARAYQERRVLVTLDKDFGELAVVRGQPHAGIIRLVGIAARQQGRVCNVVIERYGPLLAAGAIVTVEPTRVRVRLPPETDVD